MERRIRKCPIGSLTKSFIPFVRPFYPGWVGWGCIHLRDDHKPAKEANHGYVYQSSELY